jgi:hypothetical protein
MHQQYPFISVWDDHETANNSYKDGAENHTPATEGPWNLRKAAGQEANDEWIPRRLPEAGNTTKIWRKISYGNLADIFLLDTRLYARTVQGGNVNDMSENLGSQPHDIGSDRVDRSGVTIYGSTNVSSHLADEEGISVLEGEDSEEEESVLAYQNVQECDWGV